MKILFLSIHTYPFCYNHLCNLSVLEVRATSTSPKENTLEKVLQPFSLLCVSLLLMTWVLLITFVIQEDILSLLLYDSLSHSHLGWVICSCLHGISQALHCSCGSVTEQLGWGAQLVDISVRAICVSLRKPGSWDKQEVTFKICGYLKKHGCVGKAYLRSHTCDC